MKTSWINLFRLVALMIDISYFWISIPAI